MRSGDQEESIQDMVAKVFHRQAGEGVEYYPTICSRGCDSMRCKGEQGNFWDLVRAVVVCCFRVQKLRMLLMKPLTRADGSPCANPTSPVLCPDHPIPPHPCSLWFTPRLEAADGEGGAPVERSAAERAQQLADVALAVYEAGGRSIHLPLDQGHPLVSVLCAALSVGTRGDLKVGSA